MANTKISALPAVATPALTDQFAVNQGGASKKETLQQILGASGAFAPNGTSRLRVASTTSLELGIGVVPLFVNSIWQHRALTSVITISNASLSANTLYRVYMFDSAGTSTLELSTTARATDTAYGVEIKSGDATRTLVGMIRTNASSQFVDSATQIFAVSWYNRKGKSGTQTLSTDKTTTSSSIVELDTTRRMEFISWSDTDVVISGQIGGGNSVVAAFVDTALSLDGSAVTTDILFHQYYSTIANNAVIQTGGVVRTRVVTEGYHYVALYASIGGAGTGNWSTGYAGTGNNWAVQVWG